jgi:hypothetical protein
MIERHFNARSKVCFRILQEMGERARMREQHVDFKPQQEAPDVDVAGSDGSDFIVYDDHFFMKKPARVFKYASAGLDDISKIGVRDPSEHGVIGPTRIEDLNLNAAQGGKNERV